MVEDDIFAPEPTDYERDQAEINVLINELERARDGANVHTVNKAIFYLRSFSEKEDDRLEGHIKNCKVALATKTWSILAYAMRRLW